LKEKKVMASDTIMSLFPNSWTNLNIVSLFTEINPYSGEDEKLILHGYKYMDEREQREFDKICELINGQNNG
jgi:hypothetical protein